MVVVTIIIALLTALATSGVAVFQSVKGDIHAAETRVSERVDRVTARIDRVNERIEASEVKLREEIQDSEARQNKRIDEVKTELKQDNAELKADIRAMDNKLDQVLEALLTARS